jgi:hypothetical protein
MVVAVLTLVLPTGASAASWSQRRITDDPPTAMTVDDLGHVHVVTQSGAGLRYLTNANGRWSGRTITSFGSQPSIALSAGKVYVVFARISDCEADQDGCDTDPNQGLYVATNGSGTWRTQRLSGTRPAYWPSLRMRNGKLHIAYNHLTGIRYLTDSSGTWVDRQVWSVGARLTSAARTSIALDRTGHPYIAFMRTGCTGPTDFGWCTRQTVLRGVFLTTRIDGRWMANIASHPGDERDTLDRVVIDPDGKPVVGYTHRLDSGALRFRVTRFDEMDAPASRTLPGSGRGSFTLDASGRIELVRWAEGRLTWRAERTSGWLSRTWSAPRIEAAWVRSVDGVTTIVRDGFAASVSAYSTWLLNRIPAAPTAAFGPMAVVNDPGRGSWDAGNGPGRLSIGERCVVLIGDRDGTRQTLVFRDGQVRWDPEHRRIHFRNPAGGWFWLRDGQRRLIFGGYDFKDDAGVPPPPPWVVLPAPDCPGNQWLATDLDWMQ